MKRDLLIIFAGLCTILFIITGGIFIKFNMLENKVENVSETIQNQYYDYQEWNEESYNRDQETLKVLDRIAGPLEPGDEGYDPDWLDNYDTEMCEGLRDDKIKERYTGYEGYYCTRDKMTLNHLRGGCHGEIFIKCENLIIYEDNYRDGDACDDIYFPYKVIASKTSDRTPGWSGYLTKEYLLNNCKAFNYRKDG